MTISHLPDLPDPLPNLPMRVEQCPDEVFTHSGSVSELRPNDYERLACLGNAVLNLLVTQVLVDEKQEFTKGQICEIKKLYVAHQMVNRWGLEYKFDREVSTGKDMKADAAFSANVAGECFRAYLGALFKEDQVGALEFVKALMAPSLGKVDAGPKGSKNVLREFHDKVKKLKLPSPEYEFEDLRSPPDGRYQAKCMISGNVVVRGIGRSKLDAKRAAADSLLKSPQLEKALGKLAMLNLGSG